MEKNEELCNTGEGADEETLIREKKRARRVSFAENTSVHIFQRDDDSSETTTSETTTTNYSTTPPSSSSIENAGDDDDDDNIFDDLGDFGGSSISTPGSATSNDEEDNYFGPVSTSFIRQSQTKSDSSPASDINHDITLDSTAMSLHFQSLLHPTASSNFHTPTITPKSTTTTTTTGSGSSMILTHKKPPVFPFLVASGGDSSDMSLIESNPSNKYDYGKLSPTLEALLAQGYHASDDRMSISKSLSNHLNNTQVSSPTLGERRAQVSSPTLGERRVQLQTDYKEKESVTEDIPIQMGSSNTVEPNAETVIPSTPNNLANASVITASPAHQKQTLLDSIQDQYSKLATVEQRQELADGANALRDNANAPINIGKWRGIVDKDSQHQSSQKEHANVGDFHTPMRWMHSVNSPLGSPEMSFLTRTDPTKSGKMISVQKSLHKSASPRVRKTATAIRLPKRVVDSGTGKESQPFSESDSMRRFVRKGPLSYVNIESSERLGHDHQHQNQILQKNISVQDVDGYGRKRRIEDTGPMDKSNVVEIGNKNPTVNMDMGGSVSEDCSNLSRVVSSEAEKSRAYEAQRHWANSLKELSGDIKGLLIPSIEKLNTRELEILENMVLRMQKVTKYEKLCSLAKFQKTHDLQATHHQERIAEARCVQETLVYERAKMLLLRANQERLRKQVQLLQSGIQEAINLKFHVKKVLQNGAKAHMKNTSSSNSDAYNKVIAKRQELGGLDLKVKNLTKSVLASCKIKEKPSPDKCIPLINDYLKRKTRCRLVQKELQFCEVAKLEIENGHHIVVLNYYNVLLQRFTKSHASYSTLITFNTVNIMKSFPNINALTAFAFVFNEVTRNLVSSKSLAAETQMTRSLLHSLLLLVEEARQACIELRNLVQTSFRSPRDGLLELEICFVDFKTGNKVKLILDVTCLNCGVYPRDLNSRISLTKTVHSLSNDIEAAIKAPKAGCLMILRLCRSVSQVLRTASR